MCKPARRAGTREPVCSDDRLDLEKVKATVAQLVGPPPPAMMLH